MHGPAPARPARRALPGALALALTAGLLGTAHGAPGPASRTIAEAPAGSATGSGLSASQASAKARATGAAVTVDTLTTATSRTTANPDGSFTLSTSPAPVRVRKAGSWVNLDATLAANPDNTLSPIASTGRLVLSGGGSAALATLTLGGRTISITLPAPLPAPTLSGASATYSSVLPDADLVVTATAQGGYSDVFVVKTAAAATNPQLATLMKATITTTGLSVTTDPAGDLTASDPEGAPVFTAPAPTVWDSATTPASAGTGAAPAAPSPSPTSTGAAPSSGQPLQSSVHGPGENAHTAAMAAAYSSGTLTLSPPASLLTGSTTDYPVYIDPSVNPSVTSWTMVNSYYNTTSYFDSGTANHMQVGYNGWSSPYFTARSFTTLNLSNVPSGAVISSAQVNFWEDWAPSCSAREVDLYTTGPISKTTTWNNQPSWGGEITPGQNVAKGYGTSCSAGGVGWDITNQVISALSGGSTLTLGLRAADETDAYGWKQFNGDVSGETPTNAQVTYDLTPDTPSGLYTSPATDCSTTTLGDTAVSLYAPVFTRTGANLTTTFTLYKTTDSTQTNLLTPANGVAADTYSGPSGQPAVMVLPETFFKTLANATSTSFSWQAQTTDGTLTSAWSGSCTFSWDASRPGAPGIAATSNPTTGKTCPPVPAAAAYPVGTLCSFTLTPPNNTTISGYTYQLNEEAAETIAATGTTTITVTLPRIVNTLTVSALSPGGNVGTPTTPITIEATTLNPPAKDGDLTNDGTPDLIIPGAAAASSNIPPGLWLATGNVDGTVNPTAVNIGTAGLWSTTPTATSPAEWNGAQAITGDFCGLGAQDVLAYVPGAYNPTSNPHGGGGAIACSTAGATPLDVLNPITGSQYDITAGSLADSAGNTATQIANAGNTTGAGTGNPDLLATINNQLYLFAAGAPGGYTNDYVPNANAQCTQSCDDLTATPTPDGQYDWNSWTITTAQLAGGTAMYLWKPATGDLYLWTALTLPATPGFPYATTLSYTQAKLASNFNTGKTLTLRAADINGDGTADLWTVNTAPATTPTATAYLLTNFTGTTGTLTATSGEDLATPAHDWILNDAPAGTVATAADTTGTLPLTGTTGATWNPSDPQFSPDIALNGTSGSLSTAGAAVTPNTDFTISAWVKPTVGSATILSQDGTNDSAFTVGLTADGHWQIAMNNNATTTASYDTDTGAAASIGAWTRLTLSYTASSKTLALWADGGLTAALTATAPPAATGPLRIGAKQTAGATTGYYTGEIADIQTFNTVRTTQISPALGTFGDVTGDGKPDLLAIDPSGNLLLYPNSGSGTGVNTFTSPPTQVGSGWTGFTLDAVADLYHTGRAGLLVTDPSGNLLYYFNTGSGSTVSFGSILQVGTGWTPMRIIGLTDLYGTGNQGILTVNTNDGTLLYYPNTGAHDTNTFGAPTQVGSGWNGINAVVGTVNGTRPDILTLDNNGNLSLYPNLGGTGLGTFGGPSQVGTGLTGYKLIALTDPYTTGRNGYITVDTTNGNLYYTPNTGGTGLGTFGTPTLIGTGWNPYTIN